MAAGWVEAPAVAVCTVAAAMAEVALAEAAMAVEEVEVVAMEDLLVAEAARTEHWSVLLAVAVGAVAMEVVASVEDVVAAVA